MANNTIKQCGYCNHLHDENWKNPDSFGNYVCPYCGAINHFSDDASQAKEEKELNEVYLLLDNTQFTAASDRLTVLRNKYPNSSKVYFLTVLADNRVCFTEDDKRKGYFIPTLNDLPTSSLLESAYAKKALELAPSDLVRDSYKETFDYIERKRLEIQEAANDKENQYDIFISTKVTLIENGREVLGGDGKPKESPDCAFARDLYNDIREQYPGKKVFFSQTNDAKAKMAGQRFENVIYAALHSAKVFILVAESRENIEWRWVRNEWMRYLMIKDREEPGKRNFVLVTHKLKPVDFPRELSGYNSIDFDSVSALRQLKEFFDRSFSFGQERKKMEAKSFDDSVEKIELGEITDTISTRKLRTRVEEDEDTNARSEYEYIARVIRDAHLPMQKQEAFNDLAKLLQNNPGMYDAQKLMLLKNTDYKTFEGYINNTIEIIKNPSVAAEFFEFALEKDAKKVLNNIVKTLNDDNFYFGFKEDDMYEHNDEWKPWLASTLKLLIIPFLDSIDAKLLPTLASVVSDWIYFTEILAIENETEQSIVDSFFTLKRFIDGNDPEKYIQARSDLLYAFEEYVEPGDEDYKRIEEKLVGEILAVNPGECKTIWLDFCYKKHLDIYAVEDLLKDIETGKVNFPVVGDKFSIDTFKKLFKYSKKEERNQYMLLFLTAIINDKKSYEKEEGQETLLLSKDIDNSGTIDDDELNGLDLFNKYIEYELPDVSIKSTLNVELKNDSPLLKPNEDAYLKKENPTVLDKLLCSFAVKMHKEHFYVQAVSLYDTYLAQQDSIKTLDCLFVRYYKELAGVRILEPNELKRVSVKIQHKDIDIDLVQLEKKNKQATVLFDKIAFIVEMQGQYLSTYQPIKELVNQIPREKTIDKVDALCEIRDQILAAINKVSPEIKNDLECDFAFELDYFNNGLKKLIDIKKQIEVLDDNKAATKKINIEINQLSLVNQSCFPNPDTEKSKGIDYLYGIRGDQGTGYCIRTKKYKEEKWGALDKNYYKFEDAKKFAKKLSKESPDLRYVAVNCIKYNGAQETIITYEKGKIALNKSKAFKNLVKYYKKGSTIFEDDKEREAFEEKQRTLAMKAYCDIKGETLGDDLGPRAYLAINQMYLAIKADEEKSALYLNKRINKIEIIKTKIDEYKHLIDIYDGASQKKQHLAALNKVASALLKDAKKEIGIEKKNDPVLKRKRVATTIVIIISLLIVAALALTFLVFLPQAQKASYDSGVSLLNKGDYQAACEKLENTNYKDSKKQYNMAKAGLNFQDGDYNEGIKNVCEAGGTVEVIYNANGGAFSKTKDTITSYAPISTKCTKDYYTFTDWSINSFSIATTEDSYNCDLSLKAQFELTQYKITYQLNGGENNSSNPQTYTYESNDITLKAPTKTGNTFVNWTKNGDAITSIPKHSHGDVVVTANWNVNQYTLTLDCNGGSIDVPKVYTVNYGASFSFPTPSRKGLSFDGWYDGNTKITPSSWRMPAKDITLKAEYINSAIDSFVYTDIYDKNSDYIPGDGIIITGFSSSYYGSELIIPNTIKGQKVIAIASYAFDNAPSGITYLEIEPGLDYIATGALNRFSNLQELVTPFIGAAPQWLWRYTTASNYLLGAMFGTNNANTEQVYYMGHGYADSKNKSENLIETTTSTYYQDTVELFVPASLKKVKVTQNLKVYYGAFSNCVNLEEIQLLSGTTTYGFTFSNCPATVTYY